MHRGCDRRAGVVGERRGAHRPPHAGSVVGARARGPPCIGLRPGGCMTMPYRVTILQTHPAQYMAPWFRYIASERRDLDVTVLYASTPMPAQQGVGFNESFAWDVGLTDGYSYKILAEPR